MFWTHPMIPWNGIRTHQHAGTPNKTTQLTYYVSNTVKTLSMWSFLSPPFLLPYATIIMKPQMLIANKILLLRYFG